MILQNSLHYKSIEPLADIENIIRTVPDDTLKQIIQTASIPRHYTAEHTHNKWVANWIQEALRSDGYHLVFQGNSQNIIAFPTPEVISPVLVVAAHYDTVPGSPGADDNGSGIAVLLTCASILSKCYPLRSTLFILFNREEEGQLGSYEFIREYIQQRDLVIAEVHVLEMVGYCSHEPNTQQTPSGFPIHLPTQGDFLGIVGNNISTRLVESVLTSAKTYLGRVIS